MIKRLHIVIAGLWLTILGAQASFSAPVDLSAQYGASLGLATVDTVNPQASIIGPFGGLNTQDNPAIISASQSQDLLNVDITPGGKSVKKRQGYALDTTFNFSTTAVHGAYKFFDSSGNEIRLVGQDTGLYASVGGLAWVAVATGTLSTTWQCTDYLGFAYCVTSSRDTPVKTNGTASGTSYQPTIPAGTMVMSTPDRLVVGNTAANPSRLSYSGSVNFTDFTLGTLITSSSFEDIAAPGSQLTHMAYHYGRWLWWKDQSFGYLIGTDQTNLQLITVSDTIGTLDNTDIFWQGITYFRGADDHIYAYDGSTLTPLTRDITPTATSANRRKSNSWTQTSQSDFNGGTIVPTVNLSTAISNGDVVVSSFQAVENSSTQWVNGSTTALTINPSSLTLQSYLTDNFADMSNWTQACGTVGTGSGYADFQSADTAFNETVISSPTGNFVTQFDFSDTDTIARNETLSLLISTSIGQGLNNGGYYIGIRAKSVGNLYEIYLASTTGSSGNGLWNDGTTLCSNTGATTPPTVYISSFSFPYDTSRHTVKLTRDNTNGKMTFSLDNGFVTSNTNTAFTTFKNASFAANQAPGIGHWQVDNYSLKAGTGAFVSKVYDTGITSMTYSLSNFAWTANTSSPTFSLQTSSANPSQNWVTTVASSGTNAIGNRYARYVSTLTTSPTDSTLTAITSVTMLARSTGTYYSAVDNAPSLTAWSNLGITDSVVGQSSITYYSRASTNPFNITSSTPTWILQPKNGTVAASTGTYMQLRADFYLTAATETPTLSDFTFNWYEGNASDKMYATYFDYGLWFAVSLGTTTTTNNRILRYDLLNQIWTVYDIGSNGFLVYNNFLYIGSPSVGKLFKFGNGVTSDNNVAINSYWKSKDFFGASPFLDEDMRTISWYTKESSGTLNVTYTTNGSSSTAYTVNLYDASKAFIRNNRNLQIGTQVNTINFKFGDNSTNALWEVFAGGYTYVPRPWNATSP